MDGNGALHIPAGELSGYDSYIQWSSIDLRLRDGNGDDVLEAGTGRIAGTVFPQVAFDLDVTAAPDAVVAGALASRQGTSLEMLPWEPIAITLGQPVTSDQIERYRVLANGQEVPGTTEPVVGEGDVHTQIRFVPAGFYPLGATVEVEIAGMKNAVGVPVEVESFPMQVQADPGSFAGNLGFESELDGWYTVGDAAAVTSAGEVLPVEGAAMAALRIGPDDIDGYRESRLIGYLDVPADATTLDLSLALLVPDDALPQSVVMRLHHIVDGSGHEALEVYDLDLASAMFEPCSCGGIDGERLTRRTRPFRHEIDVSALRGERVFLEIDLQGGAGAGVRQRATPLVPPLPPAPTILLVDDLQLR